MAVIVGLAVFLMSVMGTSVHHVASAMFTIIVLLSFSAIKRWKYGFLSLSNVEKIFLLSFVFYAVSGALAYINTDDVDKYFRLFERYFRFFMAVPVFLFLVERRLSALNYLYAGAVISGPFLLVIAMAHYYRNPDVPAQGYYHHIIFGQLAMLNVGIMLSLLLTRTMDRKIQLLIMASLLCGVVTAIMSQARGVWLVLPIYVLIVVYYTIRGRRLSFPIIMTLFTVIVLIALMTPIGGVIKQRTEAAVNEVSRFYTEDHYISSVGTRLAMWDIAIDVWKQHPLFGTGPGDFDDEVMALQQKGEYLGMDVHNSVHNIYIQALVGSGLVGLAALLLAVVIAPLRLFLAAVATGNGAGLAGLVVIISYAVFGVSESWILRLPAISVFVIYVCVIAAHISLERRDQPDRSV